MKTYEISVSTVHDCADAVAAVLFDCGSEGVATYDRQDLVDLIEAGKTWDYVEENLSGPWDGTVTVKGYFSDAGLLPTVEREVTRLREFNQSCGSLEVTGAWLDDADYAEEWKKYYRPITVGRLAIVPGWLPAIEGKTNLFLDPGAAFGNGAHDTTYMCLEAIESMDLDGVDVLDLGCGSGILGLAALKSGAVRVTLADVEENAIEVARRNAERNGLFDRCEFFCGDVANLDRTAPVLFANITADVLIRLAPEIGRHLASRGTLLLSGIIDREFERVRSVYARLGYRERRRIDRGDWHSLILEKGE